MERRDFAPFTRGHPLPTERVAAPQPPTGLHSFVADPTERHAHEPLLDHSTVKPHSASAPTQMGGLKMRGDRNPTFFSSDDGALSKQIVATHAPDFEELNVRPVLAIVEEILHQGRPTTVAETALGAGTQTHLHTDKHDEKAPHTTYHEDRVHPTTYHGDRVHPTTYHEDRVHPTSTHISDRAYYDPEQDAEIVKMLAYPINKISCEIVCKCTGGGESHTVTMELLRSLSTHSWAAKAVVIFAAFAINYGEFWLVEHFHTKDPLAKNIATLKDLPDIMSNAAELKKKFDNVMELLNTALKVTHCIIEFNELPQQYISRESPEITAAMSHIPTAVYWIIRSLLVCSATLLSLIGSGMEGITSTSESWEILSLTHKLQVIMDYLHKLMDDCKGLVTKRREEDAYVTFVKIIETAHIDNMKLLRAMFRSREDQRPLYDGSKGTKERLEVLRLKYVLLLITDLEIPQEELNVLHLIYNQESMRPEYEVLWLPIMDPMTAASIPPASPFYELRKNMPWYSVDHPSLIEPVAVRYIREVWKFNHMPMLVVLDPQGKPSNLDALPMMWIWGGTAFPFTRAKENALWAGSTWNIELLADAIDPRLAEWTRNQRVICLYGGEDIEWIRRFTIAARAIANELRVDMEMLYVGKRNPKEKVRRCHEIIKRENLSHVFPVEDYYDFVWYFWVRLWSMWNSKRHIGMTEHNDRIMQEIMDLFTYDGGDQGWAVFGRGNLEITKANADRLLPVLDDYRRWMGRVDTPDKFVTVLDEELRGIQPEHHCNRLILPGHTGYIPEMVVCSECGKTMDKYVMYRCCTD